ncbi:hypothetical protein GGX14DRAFT_579986 [Mycena pura]|uniref:Uncharacterized protein n=1 Tax=Mycena pura TaxID=153505 RepID=A0AAD6UQT8_9AGAR|nr:hypothetical protein GGX14DRAFT_579986 [Mycena pura]
MVLFSSAHFGVAPGHAFDPQHKFITSWLVSPAALAGIRALLALYALCATCTILGFYVSSGEGKSFLSYFSELSYIGLAAYYCAAAVQTAAYARWGRYPLRCWPRALQALHVVLQSTVGTFPFIVTVVFWVLLASSKSFDSTYHSALRSFVFVFWGAVAYHCTLSCCHYPLSSWLSHIPTPSLPPLTHSRAAWSNITLHALNSAFALFELLLTNAPPAPWRTLPLHLAILAAYLGVAYITHATQGFYTYAFLDPANGGGRLAAYIVGIAAGECVVFLLARGAVVLRQRATVAVRAGQDDDAPRAVQEPHESVEGVEKQHSAFGEKAVAQVV